MKENNPGRFCPTDYSIDSRTWQQDAQIKCDVLYVVGGLYGNPFALAALNKLASAENPNKKTVVIFNGDAHWFDKTAENFEIIENGINGTSPKSAKNATYIPLVGNVEAELRRVNTIGAGCGCAYPPCVSDESVARSNAIHEMMFEALLERPELKERLVNRAATAKVSVAGINVGITHGDEKLIGGWECSREEMRTKARQEELNNFLITNNIDVFATTHTCATAAIRLQNGYVINNGAAGLPNFKGNNYGLCVRVSCANNPSPSTLASQVIFDTRIKDAVVQAVSLPWNTDEYLNWFDALWEAGSPAEISYRGRIKSGTGDVLSDAILQAN